MGKQKVVCIIQARMGSTRLPGKILFPVKNKPMIAHTINRLKQCRNVDQIVLATSRLPEDRRLIDLAASLGTDSFTGSELDVLDRFYQAGKQYQAQVVVRCTGDCPVIDPEVTDLIIDRHLKNGNDYTSNTVVRTYPRGLDTEVMNFEVLERAAREAQEPFEREHVTPYIYQRPDIFTVEQVEAESNRRQPWLRLTVDTQEDFDFMTRIFDELYDETPFFSVDDVLTLINRKPELKNINRHIQQKPLL